MKPRKTPLRRCTGCQEMKDKRELIRVVLNKDGGAEIDLTGKAQGRGAYVCKTAACLEKAIKSRGFDRSFKQAVPKEVYEKLREKLSNLTSQA